MFLTWKNYFNSIPYRANGDPDIKTIDILYYCDKSAIQIKTVSFENTLISVSPFLLWLLWPLVFHWYDLTIKG